MREVARASRDSVWHFFGVENKIATSIIDVIGDGEVRKYRQRSLNPDRLDNFLKNIKIEKKRIHYIVFTMGVISANRLIDQSRRQWVASLSINAVLPIKIIERFNRENCQFRFLYISSESASKGSFDGAYFIGKAAVELFVRECRLSNPRSSVLCIAPSMIGDAGMTTRRRDQHNVEDNLNAHPKRRHLTATEVANLCIFYLLSASDYLTNTTISLNGGKFARMPIS
jgi:NADP-dependent 3-hydroxy acid dehydrogenase YdfG